MDRKLRPHRDFARAFIDDMVVFSKIADKHIYHLRQVFSLFAEIGLSLSPMKSFLAYPSVQLLGHRVDGLGMSTTEERVSVIKNLVFPSLLKELETFIGMIGYLR
jgi:hypothetical protein